MDAGRDAGPSSKLLTNVDFRLLWLGEGGSVLGDQFYLIALPWLVLRLTGDAAAMAAVLATAAAPRAVLMPIGGVVTDRVSARRVMLATNAARLLVVVVLCALVLSDSARLWTIYVCALCFGVADALFFPARSAVLPQLVAADVLPRANAIIVATERLAAIGGAALAGILIASDADRATEGVGLALLVDAATFVLSIVCLARIRVPANDARTSPATRGTVAALRVGLQAVLQDRTLRVLIPFFACMSFIAQGVVGVGVPVLAHERLGGAAAFGSLMSALAVGSLTGVTAVGLLPSPPRARVNLVAMLCFTGFGVGMCLLSRASTLPLAAASMTAMGACGAYGEVQVTSWIQARVPTLVLGRVMSLLMLCTMGLGPLAMAVFGHLLTAHAVAALLAASGLLYATLAMVSLSSPDIRRSPAAESVPAVLP